LFKWFNALNDFCSVKIYLAKKDKKNLTNVQFSKNYVGLISSSQLRIRRSEGNTLVNHRKIKNTKGIKRHENTKRENETN